MWWPRFRTKKQCGEQAEAERRDRRGGHASAPQMETLEPRLLLSGSGIAGDLPDWTHTTDSNIGEDYRFYLPDVVHPRAAGEVAGRVFIDSDRDGLWDPEEHASEWATVFDDVNGDGVLNPGEASAVTDSDGLFVISGLSEGVHTIRLDTEYYHLPSLPGSDVHTVELTTAEGVDGLSFTVIDNEPELGYVFNGLWMEDAFQTGTRVQVPVILTNDGADSYRGKTLVLKFYASSDRQLDSEDLYLGAQTIGRRLKPQSDNVFSIGLDLPDALADFSSHLLMRPVYYRYGIDSDGLGSFGHGMSAVSTDEPVVFGASGKPTNLTADEYKNVLSNWDPTTPYGGVEPGYGFNLGGDGYVGLHDLDIILRNWNAGTPLPPVAVPPTVFGLDFGHDLLIHDKPIEITAHVNSTDIPTIDRVLFFLDKDADGELDDLLGYDSDGSDGYRIQVELAPGEKLPEDGRVVAVTVKRNGSSNAYHEFFESGQAVTVTADKPLRFRQASDGRLVEVSVAGRGSAEVILDIDGRRAYDLGNAIDVLGDATIRDIKLTGTSGRSRLKIDVTGKPEDGQRAVTPSIDSLTGTVPLGQLIAPQVNFDSIQMLGRGLIKSMNIGKLGGLMMQNPNLTTGVKIAAKSLSGKIEVDSPIKQVKAIKADGMQLVTPSAESIQIRRDLLRSTLTFTDAEAVLSMERLEVGRAMRRTRVNGASSIQTIRAAQMANSRVMAGADTLGLATMQGLVPTHGLMNRHTIGAVDVGLFADSSVSAWRLGTVSVDDVRHNEAVEDWGLKYRRLRRYDGPKSLERLRL